jgi:hypothetical protein
MNKEDMLLKNFSILSKDPEKCHDALCSALLQLLKINPGLAIRCWETCIRENISKFETDFEKKKFSSGNGGYWLTQHLEYELCKSNCFVAAIKEFAGNKFLLDVLYTKSPIESYVQAPLVISYLIRKNRLQEADNILSAIYKNKIFSAYAHLWDEIIKDFRYGSDYTSCLVDSRLMKQPKNIRDYCIGWIERIKDEEEQAGAMTFAMQMYE